MFSPIYRVVVVVPLIHGYHRVYRLDDEIIPIWCIEREYIHN